MHAISCELPELFPVLCRAAEEETEKGQTLFIPTERVRDPSLSLSIRSLLSAGKIRVKGPPLPATSHWLAPALLEALPTYLAP